MSCYAQLTIPIKSKFSTSSSYAGSWIKVDRVREQHTLDLHMGVPWETVTLTSFGRNKQLYYNILEDGNLKYAELAKLMTCF